MANWKWPKAQMKRYNEARKAGKSRKQAARAAWKKGQ